MYICLHCFYLSLNEKENNKTRTKPGALAKVVIIKILDEVKFYLKKLLLLLIILSEILRLIVNLRKKNTVVAFIVCHENF